MKTSVVGRNRARVERFQYFSEGIFDGTPPKKIGLVVCLMPPEDACRGIEDVIEKLPVDNASLVGAAKLGKVTRRSCLCEDEG
ncbi:MAG: hypothetical protein A2V87_08745 [Deltaproteobacteria bacterium RBG_16_58_17]|nr:MAG: hypothetical protein A2V87_08745 [Deltaproteobacteria bacterium RBG_16_58_17]